VLVRVLVLVQVLAPNTCFNQQSQTQDSNTQVNTTDLHTTETASASAATETT
jgi:hypothetical protein